MNIFTKSDNIKEELQQLRVVFMGTPEFAVASLSALVDAGLNIVGVVTAPDKPAGRGMLMQSSAVKQYALSKNLRILQPLKLKDEKFISELQSLGADIFIVVAFRMLPEAVWQMPPLGTVNVHASLLPQYRGAAPINWAIINGEKQTGVTTFKLKHQIDTGNILKSVVVDIGDDETAGELHDKLKAEGARLLLVTIEEIASGNITEIPQPASADDLKHAPKIFTETCKIDWTRKTDVIFNLIRGLSPYPGAFTMLNDKILKIYKAEKEYGAAAIAYGGHISDKQHVLKFATADGFIHVKELQLEGKKRMTVEEFLRGYKGL
jgi:methionyl-tRNA formyltransferase